jgi:hypothetical protein
LAAFGSSAKPQSITVFYRFLRLYRADFFDNKSNTQAAAQLPKVAVTVTTEP